MPSQVTTTELIKAARSLLGVKFRHQGRDPETGLDCLGLVEYSVYLKGLITAEQFTKAYQAEPFNNMLEKGLKARLDEVPLREVRDADIYLLRFRQEPQHVGFAATRNNERTIIHCLRTESGANNCVIEETLQRWERHLVKAFRIRELTFTPEVKA
jgi:hypothetical protein